ncbi:MAG TPA: CAP domain-containing protein [Pyrinomonadaceae bacterium]|nr:CAP domain-containing protein [Pyrinomonadaceae bacterium]
MTRKNLFPCTRVRVRRSHARFALPAIACLFVAGLFAGSAEAQTKTTRPVARLIGATTGGGNVSTHGEFRETTARLVSTSMTNAPAATRARTTTVRVAPTSMEQRAFELINAQRRARGESSLVWDAELTRMARLHSENMSARNFFAHTDPQGQNVVMRASMQGVTGWSAIAENIAYNSGYDDPAAFAVERWLVSAKHRENMLRRSFTHSGIGVARAADGRVFFTQVFVTR